MANSEKNLLDDSFLDTEFVEHCYFTAFSPPFNSVHILNLFHFQQSKNKINNLVIVEYEGIFLVGRESLC